MATNTGKGKKKGNKKTIPLAVLLAEGSSAPQGFNVVNTGKLDWAESMEDDLDDTFTLNYKRVDSNKVLLPTAPKATRGPDIDMSRVPNVPPFKAYLGNLPYDVTQDEITGYFSNLNIKDVRLPHLNGRQRGFAYAEFPDRQSLIDALTMNGDMFRNRLLKVGLPGDNDNNSRDSNREERQDRTATDWRAGAREDDSSARDMNRDTYQSYSSRNGSNDYSDKSMQRSRGNDSTGYGNRDRFESDRTFRPSTDDRGFDRSNNYSNDRGFDRSNNRYGNRFNDRSDGFEGREETRDYGYESNERSYGRRFDDSNRYQNRNNFNERRTENRREFGGGFDRRRDDTQYEARNTSSPHEVEEEQPKERRRLALKPRSKPIETGTESAAANSAIFGGAKPVDTAAREQEIEQKLLKEKEESDKKRENSSGLSSERIRRISAGSNVSGNSRSRKGSDSGPVSRDFDDNYRSNGSNRNSSRKNSERSDRSNASNDSAPKYIMTRNKDPNNSSQASRIVSVREPARPLSRGTNGPNGPNRINNNNNNIRRKDRDRERENRTDLYRPPRMNPKSDDDDEKKVAYTTSNKFAHLSNEDYDEDDVPHIADD